MLLDFGLRQIFPKFSEFELHLTNLKVLTSCLKVVFLKFNWCNSTFINRCQGDNLFFYSFL